MVEDGADVAPMAIEVVAARRRRATAEFEHALGASQTELAKNQLRPSCRQRALDQGILDLGIAPFAKSDNRPVECRRRTGDRRVDREGIGRDFADDLLDEWILVCRFRTAVGGRARLAADIEEAIGKDVAHRAGSTCRKVQLAQRRAVATDEIIQGAPGQFVRKHFDIV